ncbi:unnamed protein product [Sphagnum balticum]
MMIGAHRSAAGPRIAAGVKSCSKRERKSITGLGSQPAVCDQTAMQAPYEGERREHLADMESCKSDKNTKSSRQQNIPSLVRREMRMDQWLAAAAAAAARPDERGDQHEKQTKLLLF